MSAAADVTPEMVEAEIVEARERVAADGPWANKEYKVIAALADERDRLRAQLAACPAPVAVEVPEILSRLSEWEEFRSQFSCLSYHHSGMGCGIEDRGIHDRYEACEYGWEEAMERVAERMPEEHGELPEIDPSRILKDGHVQVPVEDWKELRAFARISGYPEGRFTAEVPFGKDFEKWGTDIARRMGITRGEEQAWIDALRSGEAEGRMG